LIRTEESSAKEFMDWLYQQNNIIVELAKNNAIL